MSRIRTNIITNRMANGAPTVSNGLVISGVTTTSEILVGNNIKLDPVSGIVTAPAVDVNDFLNVGSNIKLGNAGVITATSFSGSGANLTSLPAGQLTGTIADARLSTVSSSKLSGALPAIDGSALTGINAGVGTEGSVNTSGIITATAVVPTTGQLSHRNIIVNGAMTISQRGTSSTSNGYTTVDRIKPYTSNIGVTPTYSQVDITSGGAYNSGFRKAWQVTKGAGTANSNSQVNMGYRIEAQDIANSGWKYTDPNSFITFSFWVKTSVSNHNPQVLIQNSDTSTSSTKFFIIDIPTLTANTWTKITQTIPGHANQVYNNDNGNGLEIQIIPWYGTDYTDAGNTTGAWTSFGTKPVNTTWLTTNGSTFQITGLQLEVGPVATPFEHRSYTEELARCRRYFYKPLTSNTYIYGGRWGNNSTNTAVYYPVQMRDTPTIGGTARRTGGTSYVGKDYFNYAIGQDDNWWENFTAESEI